MKIESNILQILDFSIQVKLKWEFCTYEKNLKFVLKIVKCWPDWLHVVRDRSCLFIEINWLIFASYAWNLENPELKAESSESYPYLLSDPRLATYLDILEVHGSNNIVYKVLLLVAVEASLKLFWNPKSGKNSANKASKRIKILSTY